MRVESSFSLSPLSKDSAMSLSQAALGKGPDQGLHQIPAQHLALLPAVPVGSVVDTESMGQGCMRPCLVPGRSHEIVYSWC